MGVISLRFVSRLPFSIWSRHSTANRLYMQYQILINVRGECFIIAVSSLKKDEQLWERFSTMMKSERK